MVREKVQMVCLVHSDLAQAKYSLKTPKPKSTRVLGNKLHA